jgi:starch phosphorylase
VRATTCFTTHTPVPAGHDRFPEDLMRRYFSDVPEWVGVPWERFWSMGLSKGQSGGSFNMTHLALHFSSFGNGVSRLHGVASRSLLHEYWPGLLQSEVPIGSITNGTHLSTWTHPRVARVLGVTDRPLRGADFERELGARERTELWRVRQELKASLLTRIRASLRRNALERGDSPLLLDEVMEGLTEEALLIGFARRFAPYKRAHLLFQDPQRLQELVASSERPLRIIVAGKAHPRDDLGKDILKKIVEITRRAQFAGKVFFVEDYDIGLARSLVQGVDVWLNNPIRMLEASGTSGMKAAANGVLNMSISDGWWPEAFDGENGWLIADSARVYEQPELQDQFDSSFLYRLLEEEVLPLYFERDAQGLPQGWLDRVAHSLRTIPPAFNTDRMVADYLRQAYGPLAANAARLSADKKAPVKARVETEQRVRRGFGEIKIVSAQIADLSQVRVGDAIDVHLEVDLGALQPADVVVELVLGRQKQDKDLENQATVALRPAGAAQGSVQPFEGSHVVDRSGGYSYGIRVRARAVPELVLWA